MKAQTYYSDQKQIRLLDAVDSKNPQKIDDAIEQGAQVNAVGKQEMTPLAWAFAKQNLVGYRHLLEKGANPNFKTQKVAWNNDGRSVMQFAAVAENPDYLLLALKHGGSPNAPDSLRNKTILNTAIANRRKENIRILANHGADLNHSDRAGFTPLMHCVTSDEYGLALVLLELGADPSIKTPRGEHVGDFVSTFGDRGIKILGKEKEQRSSYEQFVSELKRRGLMK